MWRGAPSAKETPSGAGGSRSQLDFSFSSTFVRLTPTSFTTRFTSSLEEPVFLSAYFTSCSWPPATRVLSEPILRFLVSRRPPK